MKDKREDRKTGFVDSLLNADQAGNPDKAENPVMVEHQEKTCMPDEYADGTDHNTQSEKKFLLILTARVFIDLDCKALIGHLSSGRVEEHLNVLADPIANYYLKCITS